MGERDNNLQGVSYVMVGCLFVFVFVVSVHTQDSAWKTGPSNRCRTTGRLLRCVVQRGSDVSATHDIRRLKLGI